MANNATQGPCRALTADLTCKFLFQFPFLIQIQLSRYSIGIKRDQFIFNFNYVVVKSPSKKTIDHEQADSISSPCSIRRRFYLKLGIQRVCVWIWFLSEGFTKFLYNENPSCWAFLSKKPQKKVCR
ncbi:hypothetical protein L1887_37820 [Cichorium endivia]|nr:hypothetical protein L1887_37820 [Cichorium endivia]